MNEMSEEVNQAVYKYTIKNLNLQKEPSKSAMIIKVIPAYSRFELLDSDDEWFKVSYDHREGYVYKDHVSMTKVTTVNTRLKTRPTKEAKSMKTIKKHHVVELVDQEGIFNQVFCDGKLGYIEADALSDDGVKYQTDKLGHFYYNLEKYINDQKIKSPTPFLIATDLKAKQTYVFEDVKGSWKELYRWSCTIGAAKTPTITGVFQVNGRKEALKTGRYQVKYATKIREGYYYHSVLYDPSGSKVIDGQLGDAASHGCIRLAEDQAKWIYQSILDGTTVIIH